MELILLITGLATAGGLVLTLAPIPMMKMLFCPGALRSAQSPDRPSLGAAGWLSGRSARLCRLSCGDPRPDIDCGDRGKGGLRARHVYLALPPATGGARHGGG
jgi:hypothetical protein